MKIFFCASEMVPFAKTGGLADVAGALPLALELLGHEVVVTLPRYKAIANEKFKIQKVKEGVSVTTAGRDIKVYLIEQEKYFGRDSLYGDKTGDYKDNLERFSFFCTRSLELLKEMKFKPEVCHCHDWQSALVVAYLKNVYQADPFFKDTRAVFTIHNLAYQGLFPREEFPQTGLDPSLFSIEGFEFYGKVNLLKAGLEYSDLITTVSPTYSREIQTKEFGCGLEGVLNKRRDCVFGILNGIDYTIWSPSTDKMIAKHYSVETAAEKARNKEDLQALCRLPKKPGVPLFGIVSRLAEQKGFDIIAEGINEIMTMDLQLVILGTGDLKYHVLLEEMVKKYPKVISLSLKFDDSLAHKIYAGSDIFLMPSRYEPCGLGQIISLSYGTVPLVFKTGGLADTVTSDNGFVFDDYRKTALIKTIAKSLQAFKDKSGWRRLVQKAMGYNFSWEESAKKYVGLYKKARK